MQSIKHDLRMGLASTALALMATLCWGSSSPATHAAAQAVQAQQGMPNAQQMPNEQQQMPQQTQQSESQSQTVTGTVVKHGNSYALQAADGNTYKLSNADQAAAYAGKNVTITGTVDKQSKTIQVQSISGS